MDWSSDCDLCVVHSMSPLSCTLCRVCVVYSMSPVSCHVCGLPVYTVASALPTKILPCRIGVVQL